ncbi:hypothetical protein N7522_007156 [Penicillium canescens]|uniref:F-box domain-containing protein n=1 Tax=Penicillium canescens TaxID=5083 RepID=A0AAD6N6W7_PENCN|nr:uncharacterized protein N7446_009746 [Penicillium canescens]KAJ6001929.1 hypothetical protein N7522_007156 [Penicillium canescens]KAJ6034987.1 hypothetical protein N7460_009162 [Penicillium canescens]KAJ6046650.1 hypothetical protein N7444_007904 [Penicillium canescens]KAJ6053734.1 hypothetical protein N7446_009746 [Penicillium canescens]
MASSTSCLLSLPAEILEVVIDEACASSADLSVLGLVCRGLHSFITPRLYKSVNLVGYERAKQFSSTISQRPKLAPLVRKLQIHSHGTDEVEDENCSEDFDSTITQLINLESLALRTDFFNRSKAQKIGIICRPHKVLPALRSINLGFDYYRDYEWSLTPYEALFYHSDLASISITGAAVSAKWDYQDIHPPALRSTKLEELELLNCNISSQELELMLRYPRALKSFTLKGEPAESKYGFTCGSDRGEYVDVLKAHSSSLQVLDLDLSYDWSEEIDLSPFTALVSLTITPRMLVGDRGGDKNPANEIDLSHWGELLPPSLERLTFRCDGLFFPLDGIYEAVSTGKLPILRWFACEMRYHAESMEYFREPEEILADKCTCTEGLSFSQAFEALGVNISVVALGDIRYLPQKMTSDCRCWSYQHRRIQRFW